MRLGKTTLLVALLAAGLVFVNYLASVVPARFDATAAKVYTLSPGTRAILGKISEPVQLEFYFSRSAPGVRVEIKNYAERVREMLRQYASASRGRITLTVIDPEPDTPEEEKATAAGIQPQRPQVGAEAYYFGVVATLADQQRAIAALTPDREQFLEYDLSELLYRVQQVDKKKLGLITSLPLQGTAGNPMMGQQGQEGQYIVTEWEDTFDIVPVEATATELPAGLDVLAVVHPQNLAPRLQVAVDQFLLSGKPVFIAVDPSSQYFKRMGAQAMMYGGPPPNVSSDLPALFGPWGIRYEPEKVIGDNGSATQVQLQNGTLARDPLWISLSQANFNPKSLPTAQLASMLFIEAGSVGLKSGSALTLVPLVETSPQAGEVESASLQFVQPDDVARRVKPSGKKTVAALVTGRFTTAFPDGAPKEDKPADSAAAKPAEDKSKGKTAAPAPLKASSGTSTLIVVADTDWLFDDYSLRKFNVLGTTAAEPLNDNLSFAANSLDFLSGSQDLISIRGKGTSIRPFAVVEAMAARAGEKYREKLDALEARLNEVQAKLSELRDRKGEAGRLVATPEAARAIEDFQRQQATLRAERRQIRLALREGIDALENRLLAINLLASPILVCAFGLWFSRRRRR